MREVTYIVPDNQRRTFDVPVWASYMRRERLGRYDMLVTFIDEPIDGQSEPIRDDHTRVELLNEYDGTRNILRTSIKWLP